MLAVSHGQVGSAEGAVPARVEEASSTHKVEVPSAAICIKCSAPALPCLSCLAFHACKEATAGLGTCFLPGFRPDGK